MINVSFSTNNYNFLELSLYSGKTGQKLAASITTEQGYQPSGFTQRVIMHSL